MNQMPATMTPEQFSKASSDLAAKTEAAPPYSKERADLLDQIGKLWTEQGYPIQGQMWHDAATYCRTHNS